MNRRYDDGGAVGRQLTDLSTVLLPYYRQREIPLNGSSALDGCPGRLSLKMLYTPSVISAVSSFQCREMYH